MGFSNEALIAVCSLMIIGHGLVRTGALEPVGRWLTTVWRSTPRLALLITLVLAAVFSAFVNNTPIVILLPPILITVSLRTGVETSGVLMPVGFATLLGGMSTTIGTSTNLLVVSIANTLQLPVEAFVLAVLFGVNLSFVTPMAYQTNLLVMNAGGYEFSDFVRVGAPLLLIVWLTLSVLLPMLYGF